MDLGPLHGGADPVAGAGTGLQVAATFVALLVVLAVLAVGLWAYVRRRFPLA